jgi:DNA-binding response OmpR family regulator
VSAVGVSRALEAEGHQVDVAGDGARGLELGLTGDYDVVVLDIMLPKLNGYRVCRGLREAGVRSSIVMLSAKGGEWDIADGLDLGADDYVTKPFSTVELLARIRARTRTDSLRPALATGDLRLDPDLRRCWRGRVTIPLTGRETRLLEVLFEQLGTPVTKDELLARAWGDHHSGAPNVVEVCVGRLRRKIDAPFGTDDIETIRGVGYRLQARAVVA